MKSIVLCLIAAGAGFADDLRTSAVPVLVELFTSEGCSSCPPADALLEVLDHTQPVPGVQVIVLSEHVDYWNSIGWTDPYSSPAFSRRQEAYAARSHTHGPYTPQMVVDGSVEFVGSDADRAASAIAAAAKRVKLKVRLTPSADGAAVHIEVERPRASGKRRNFQVWMALADNQRISNVQRGENRGRRLSHVAVARTFKQVGTLSEGGFAADIPVSGGGRVIAFVQESGNGVVVGAGILRLSPVP